MVTRWDPEIESHAPKLFGPLSLPRLEQRHTVNCETQCLELEDTFLAAGDGQEVVELVAGLDGGRGAGIVVAGLADYLELFRSVFRDNSGPPLSLFAFTEIYKQNSGKASKKAVPLTCAHNRVA